MYPDHTTKFTGTTIWRTLIPLSKVSHLPEVNTYTTWWYGRVGHVYTSPVDDSSEVGDDKRMLEISCRNLVDAATDTRKRFSWGVPVTNERVLSHFTVSSLSGTFIRAIKLISSSGLQPTSTRRAGPSTRRYLERVLSFRWSETAEAHSLGQVCATW